MKAVPKVNKEGHYLEDALVDDTFSGVVPFYSNMEQGILDVLTTAENVTQPEGEATNKPETNISGYIIGIPVNPGLFRPRFDLQAWNAYESAVSAAQDSFQQAMSKWQALPEEQRGDMPVLKSPAQPILWIEGLTPEEIEELTRPQPEEPDEMDRLGSEMVTRELETLELRQQNEAQGAQIVGLELRLLSLENS
ncbi:hypothetical protein V4V36_25070 [Paenibacillus lautus]|jgi:hypothetical protein|uniref:hypothetical protein n=1 Tax=Paenibacillus lautus TaxID=1401 RepID=UPI0010EEAA9A|nr:hypothetical protein [Paenibacillus lautus]MBY0160950.1 hypothetical protein [Cytobacillus firmus]MCI1776763.1 hypothetical protein [Paenibacillus lautus]VTR23622.1 Uncharacterised protein [Actinobacillus pleuropneumoniae]